MGVAFLIIIVTCLQNMTVEAEYHLLYHWFNFKHSIAFYA